MPRHPNSDVYRVVKGTGPACRYRLDRGPVLEDCSCATCRLHSMAYIHHLLNTKEILALTLLVIVGFSSGYNHTVGVIYGSSEPLMGLRSFCRMFIITTTPSSSSKRSGWRSGEAASKPLRREWQTARRVCRRRPCRRQCLSCWDLRTPLRSRGLHQHL